MGQREIAALVCKILAIYAVVIALPHLGEVFYAYGSATAAGVVVGELVTFVLLVGVGVALWQNADRLAGSMVPPLADTSAARPTTGGADILTIAFSILGLFVLTQAIPNIAGILISLFGQIIPGWQLMYQGWQLMYQGSALVFDAVTAVCG
jgi:hypothetical protein